ncbi:uncharacterized protein C8R40DRAFT_1176734 [Lentinula edodes]|uniref:uncharacterized protein n=1 Tax=Lentinula edodes TaxID=5353 RepID=UPI001E8D254E|nr:uncharacterized protein C8R40DRAFT_1176734 [Lentinula edodes]KAH7869403.1 hypothetical protein C8R40DRAFT_1176734 [Lentinula edodes]
MSSAIDDLLVAQLQENIITYSIGGIFCGSYPLANEIPSDSNQSVPGIYTVLAIIAAYILFQQGLRYSLARSVLFILNVAMFVGQTGNLVAVIVSELKILRGLGETFYDPTQALERWEVAIVVFSRMNYLLSDAIVIWRAWILYDDRLYLRILLILCGLGSLIGVSLDSAFVLKQAFSNGTGEATALTKIRVLMPVMLLITNFIATSIIAFKVWEYRRSIKINLGNQKRKTSVEQVLILLLETGLVYCACWIVTIISLTPGTLSFMGQNVFATMYPNLTVSLDYNINGGEEFTFRILQAIYPTLVIIFVAARKSYSELSINVSQTLQFAVPTPADIVFQKSDTEGSPPFVATKIAGIPDFDGASLDRSLGEIRTDSIRMNLSSTSVSNAVDPDLHPVEESR